MKLYDSLIADLDEKLSAQTPKTFRCAPERAWQDAGSTEFIMMKDAAYELGGFGKDSVNCTCVTTTPGIVPEDEIFVYGSDLNEIKSDVSFARIVCLEVDDLGEDEEAYNAIRNLEFVRYNVFPKGYMSRISAESNQEQVRLSREAVQNGITFEKVGNLYIQKYKEDPHVKHVKIVFATEAPAMKDLIADAKKVNDITKTLTTILDGIPTDCASCQMKPVCDSVDGLREMHMKQRKNAK